MATDKSAPYGIEIERLPGQTRPNYEIRRRDTDEVLALCSWISLSTGQPFAFGNTVSDENPHAEFGGRVRVESRGSGEDGIYPGARLHFQG